MTTKAEVLRIMAQALEDGAPEPISLSMYTARMSLLFYTQEEWAAWAYLFDLSPVDAVYDTKYMRAGKTNVSLANDSIELTYHQKVPVDES